MNTGFFALKASPWSVDFLEKVWAHADFGEGVSDQRSINHVLATLAPDERDARVRVYPRAALNAFPKARSAAVYICARARSDERRRARLLFSGPRRVHRDRGLRAARARRRRGPRRARGLRARLAARRARRARPLGRAPLRGPVWRRARARRRDAADDAAPVRRAARQAPPQVPRPVRARAPLAARRDRRRRRGGRRVGGTRRRAAAAAAVRFTTSKARPRPPPRARPTRAASTAAAAACAARARGRRPRGRAPRCGREAKLGRYVETCGDAERAGLRSHDSETSFFFFSPSPSRYNAALGINVRVPPGAGPEHRRARAAAAQGAAPPRAHPPDPRPRRSRPQSRRRG